MTKALRKAIMKGSESGIGKWGWGGWVAARPKTSNGKCKFLKNYFIDHLNKFSDHLEVFC